MTIKTQKTAKAPKATEVAAKAKAKKQTLNEFKAWLSGVEEMQSEDWSPDLTQWRRIREKIENIEETQRSFKSVAAGAADYEEDYPAPHVIRPAGPSGFAVPGVMNGRQMQQPIQPPLFMNTSGADGARVHTPAIDTSNGQYSSGLE